MNFATFVRNRNSERAIALLSAVAVLMSLMAIFADPAWAHHPTTTGQQACVDGEVVIEYASESWLTTGADGSAHPDVVIEVSVNGGPWEQIASGAYEAPDYSFSGTVSGEQYWGQTIRLRSQVVGSWPNGAGTGNTHPDATTAAFTVTQDCFNPSCPGQYLQYKLEPVGSSGTYGPNDAFTITLGTTSNGQVFDWESTVPVFQVVAKGGPGAEVYNYNGEFSDNGLHAPSNPNSGKYYGLSHITFCYQEIQDEPVEVEVTARACVIDAQGLPTGSARVTIDPTSGATVDVYSDAAMNHQVASLSGSGTVDGLVPGTYYWSATAADGYDLSSDATGQFTIDDCDVSVGVTAGACLIDEQGEPAGSLDVVIDPNSGATVDIFSDDAMTDLVASVSSADTVEGLEPGTYYWEATAGDGFTFEGASQGQLTIDDCESSVLVSATACTVNQQGQPVGGATITIDPDSSAIVEIYTDAAMIDQVAAVTTSGSVLLPPGTYYWEADDAPGFDLTGETEGRFTVSDCDVAVSITPNVCNVGPQGEPAGRVDVLIDPESGAVVEMFSDAAMSDLVTTVSSSDSVDLAPGTYYWAADGADGFDLTGDGTGSFTIDPCDATVSVIGACIVRNGAGVGQIDVNVSSSGAAMVEISDSSGASVAVLSDTSAVTVPVGDSYSWTATPASGFVVSGDASGDLDIGDCTPPPPPPDEGEIIVQKVVVGGAIAEFEFTFESVGFTLDDDTLAHGQQSTSGPLDPGTGYSVSEVVPSGWTLVSSSCDDGSDPSNIDLAANEQVTCTFINEIEDDVQAAIEVTVDGSCEADGDDGIGLIAITVSVADGATVIVRDSAGSVVGTVTSQGAIEVPEGATYSWEAIPAEGFEFPPGAASSGSLTIESCSNPETLPFTGIDVRGFSSIAIVLLGMGVATVLLAPRRRET